MSLGHAFRLFTKPDAEWESIRQDSESVGKLYVGHVLLLAAIPAVAAFYGTTEIGWRAGDAQLVRLTTGSALQLCILFYAAMLVGIYILGRFIDLFSRTYGADKGRPKGIILAAYTSTPMFVVGVIAAYPNPWVNLFVGLLATAYAIYLLYEGLPILMRIPKDRGFMFASSVVTVGLVMLVGLMAISVVIWGLGIGPVYVS